MPTQDEMLRALVGLDANPNNYTLADAVGNTDTGRVASEVIDNSPNPFLSNDPNAGGTGTPAATPLYVKGLAGVDRPYDPTTGYMYQTGIGGERMKGWGGGDLSVRNGAIYEGDVAPSYMTLQNGQMVSTGQTLDEYLASLTPAATQTAQPAAPVAAPQGWSTGPAGMTPGQAEVGTVDSPWYLPGTGPATFTSGEGQDQTVGSRGAETIPQDVAWRQIAPNKYQVQQYDANGLVGEPSLVDLTDPNDKLWSALIAAGMGYVLGPLAGQLGSAASGAVGVGEGALTAQQLATLGELGINTSQLGLGVVGNAALGKGVIEATKTGLLGGDLGDILESGAKTAIGATGNVLSSASNLAGLAGSIDPTLLNITDPIQRATAVASAIQSGNPLAVAASGMDLAGVPNISGLSSKDISAANSVYQGIQTGNYAGIISGANNFINSPDLAIAGKAAALAQAATSQDPTAIFNAAQAFSKAIGDTTNAAKISAAYADPSRKLDVLQGSTATGIETLFDPTRAVKKTTGDSADYGAATGIGAPGTSYTVSPGTAIPKTAGELAALANPDALGVLPGAGAAGSSYSASLAKAPDTSPAAQAVIARAANVQPTTYEQVEALKLISEMYPGQDLGWLTKDHLNAAASHIFAGDEAGLKARLTSGQTLGVTGEAPTAESFARQSKYSRGDTNLSVAPVGTGLDQLQWAYTDRGEPVATLPTTYGKSMTEAEKAAYDLANRPESDYKIDEKGDKVLKNWVEKANDFTDTLSKGLTAPLVKAVGEQLQDIGTVASWLGADPKNPVSRFGASVSAYGKEITPATVLEQQENITQAVKNESTFLGKAFAGVAAAVTNPLGFADWVGKELVQEIAPMGLALKAGQYTTKVASALGESIAAKLGLGAAVSTDAILGAGESGASAYRDVYADLKKQGLSDDVAEAGANKAAAASAMITLVTSAVGDVSLYKNLLKSSEASIGKVVSENAGSAIGKETVSEFFDSALGAGSSAVITQDSGAGWKDILTKTKLDLNNGIVGAMVGGGTTGTLVAASADPSSASYTAPSGATTDLLTGAPAATTAPATTTAGTPATQTVLTGQGGETLSAGDLGIGTGAATVTENAPDAASIIQQYVDLGLAGGQTGDAAAELAALTGTGDVAAKAGDSSAVIGTDANGQAVTISDLQALTGNTGATTTAGTGATTTVTPGADTVVATDANGQVVTLADIQALTGNTGATTTPGVTTGTAAATDTTPGVTTGTVAATDTTPGVTTGTAAATDTTPGVTTGTAAATDTTPGVTTGTAAATDVNAATNTAVNSSTVINTATNGNTATNAVVATDPNVVTTTDSNGATVNSNSATGVTTVINNDAKTIVTTDPNAQTVTATDVTANVTTVTNTATGVTVVVDSTVTPGIVTDSTVTPVVDSTVTPGIVTDTTVNPVVTPTVTTDTTVNPVVTPTVTTDTTVNPVVTPTVTTDTTVVQPPVVVEPPPPVVVEPPPPPPPPVVVEPPPPPPPPVVVEPPPPPPVVVEPPKPPPPPPKPPTPPPPPPPPRPTAAPSPSSPAGVLSQELMRLSDFDLEALFSPSLKEYRKEQRGKRNKPTEEDQMMDLLRELGYRS